MKNFSKKLAFLTLGTVAVAFTSCQKSDHPGYDKAETGLYSKFYVQDEKGVKPKEGDIVRLVMSWKNSKDSTLFDSKDPKFNRNGKDYIEFPIAKSAFNGSFEEALSSMAVGDSASFLVSADSVYMKTFMQKELPAYIEKGSLLTFNVALKKITSKEEADQVRQKKMEEQKVEMEMRKGQEEQLLAKYLADNKITTKVNASGLYFIEKGKGKGPHPNKGDQVKINYTLSFVDGKILETTRAEDAKKAGTFDETRKYEPVDFPTGGLIEGMNEGLSLMSAGSRAKLIIPSSIGYGEGGGAMPPYSTLIFDVELISFGPAEQAQGAMPSGNGQ